MAWTVRDAAPAGRRRRSWRWSTASMARTATRRAASRSRTSCALGFGAEVRAFAPGRRGADARLGYALFYPSYDTDHGAKGAYLQDLYVLPEARGRGIGRALMAAVARACQDDGGCYLFWNALESNRAGRAFYRRIGAREEPVVTLSLQPDALRRLARAYA